MPSTHPRQHPAQWASLLEAYGVLPGYRDVRGQWQAPAEDTALHLLRALGAPVWSPGDVPQAWQAWRRAYWQQAGEPVAVAWQGAAAQYVLRVPRSDVAAPAACEVALEDGALRRWETRLRAGWFARGARVEGGAYVACTLALPPSLPLGYHRLRVAWASRTHEALLIVAPRQAYGASEPRRWGTFSPLYALRRREDWGIGDWTALGELSAWVGAQGGAAVATLPTLAAFLDRPFEPSPYAPASRLAWNELFVDVPRLPELAACPEAQQLLASPATQRALAALRQAPHVDYAGVYALKRRLLALLARQLSPARREALQQFLAAQPIIEDYARYRAAGEAHGLWWSRWPQPLREGRIPETAVDPAVVQYHRYAQWVCQAQFAEAAHQARAAGVGWYADLPLGVHREGYDVWREREAFLPGCSGGAPPDQMFTTGQDWGFPPPHPEGMRRQHYRYFRACLRHHMAQAQWLRLDHVMSLYRLYVIPQGLPSEAGAYVRYPAEELAAILCLESQRHRTVVVGENLGLVPPEVTALMQRHRFQGMYIAQVEWVRRPQAPPLPAPDTIASLNTHDLHPFAASWAGRDLTDRVAAGQLSAEALPAARAQREQVKAACVAVLRQAGLLPAEGAPDAAAVLAAWLQWLARSPASLLLINLEDLWLEQEPQNMPGTWQEQPNWRRKCQFSLEEVAQHPAVQALLAPLKR